MTSPSVNFMVKSEQQPGHREVCGYGDEFRPKLVRSRPFRGKRRRDVQTEPLRRLMAAILCEAVNRFQRNLFQTSLYRRCEFVEAEFWLFKDGSEALFSFNNVSDCLSVDPRHIRQELSDWRQDQFQAASSTKSLPRTLGQRFC